MDHLSENGLIGVISPRYAYRGEGYPYGDWLVEKGEFADLFLRLRSLGASRFCVVGLSKEGFDSVYQRSYARVSEDRKQIWWWRTQVPLIKEKLENLTSTFPVPLPNVFDRLTRIDALFGQF